MSSVARRLVLLMLWLPVSEAAAQPEQSVGAPVSPSFILRTGPGVMLPVGDDGALTLTLNAFGNVVARSGLHEQPPRRVLNLGLNAGYVWLQEERERIRPYRWTSLSYTWQTWNGDVPVDSHTGGLSGGVGALAQLTPRIGLLVDVGLRFAVRREWYENTIYYPSEPVTRGSASTETSWGLVGGFGLTWRRKPAD